VGTQCECASEGGSALDTESQETSAAAEGNALTEAAVKQLRVRE
jgi:hypothetical protein